jgi:ketosteroid isomerase-like protein
MMSSNAEQGRVFGAEGKAKSPTRFDLANLHIQNYGDTVIASYTLLISIASHEGVKVASHNESRVIVKRDGMWKVVHVHKSTRWRSSAYSVMMRFAGKLALQQRVLQLSCALL